jgi:PAS domain S-box-containing protein
MAKKLKKENLAQDHTHEMAIFHAMAENAVDGMALTTLEGVITYANPASHVLFGYDPESREMVSLPLSRFFSESGLKVLVEEAIPQSLDGANWQGEVRGIRKDNTPFDLFTTVFAVRDERGDPIALTAVLRGIAERERAGEALQESEENFRALAENANDGIMIAAGKGVHVYANKRMAEITGYSVTEILKATIADLVHPDQLKEVMERFQRRLEGKPAPRQYEIVFIRKDGKSVPLEMTAAKTVWHGQPADIVVFRDITERKRAEEALRTSEAKYRELVQNANSIILRLDTQGCVTFFNEFAQSFFGYTEDEILGQNVVGTIVPERERSGRDLTAMIQDIVQHPEQYTTNENENMRRNGERVWVAWTNKAILDDDGRVSGVLCIGSDVTERKRAEAERERLLTVLEQRSTQLQTAAKVSKSASTILDPEELMKQAVNLIQERFRFYYVGLFLLDEASEYAVLQAGTGEAGQQMLKQGHKLKVGGTSMIGWCVAQGKARIALDVGEEAVRFDNPLLPETRSEMALPLISRGRVIGAMTIQSTRPAAFSEEDIAALQAMADQLANAVENARLFEEALSRTRYVTALAETGKKLASALELDAVLDSIMDACLELFQVQQACFIMMDEDGYLRMRRHRGLSEEFVRSIVGRPGEGFYGKVYQSGEAILVRDAREQLDPTTAEAVLREGITSFVHVPVKVRSETVAVMNLTSLKEDRRFGERDLERLSAFADQAATAIETARLFEETQRHAVQLRVVNEVGRTLASILDVDTLLGQVVWLIRDTFDYYQVNLGLVEGDALVPKAWAGALSTFPTGVAHLNLDTEAIVTKVVTSGTSMLVSDVRRELVYLPLPGLEEVRSELAVPLKSKDQVIGVLDVESDRSAAFDERDLTVLEALAVQIAVAIENARLFQETKSNLEEITLLHQRYLQEAWSEFAEEKTAQERAGYIYSQDTVSPASTVWRPEIGLAVQQRDTIALSDMADTLQETVEEVGTILQDSPAQSALALPLKVRGQVIGALDFYETDQARDWSAEDVAMVETVANQVALAIENARAYEELQKTAERLKEMDQIKSQFLANMSHELRTPLNSIIGFSRVILKGIDGPITEQQRADLASIYNNGQHLLGMINDILDISKIEAGKMELIFEPVDVRKLIDGVMSTAIALVKDKPIELEQEVAPDLPVVRADGTRLRQVVLNLLSNAAKFTEEGQITLKAWADEEQITVIVEDTGIGIPPKHQATIFEEFRQVDASTTRRTGGTGLGLAISRHFVEMHGGRIWVESEPDAGSTFTFTLPIAGPAPVVEWELAALTIDPNRKLILVVEDDQGAIAIYRRYLEKHGYQVVSLNQGEQAVRWALELSPHAIILDVLLPDKEGWAVLEELKSSREVRRIPVIICTVIDGEEAHGLSLGAADYLVKPILEEDLLESLQRLEERQQA